MTATLLLKPVDMLAMIDEIREGVTGETVERGLELHGALLALSTGTHIFYYGDPGVAKSLLVNRITARIAEVNHFHILMGSYIEAADIEGPWDIPALKTGHRRRMIQGYLPWAHTAFFDELWNAGDGVLNSLNSAFHERKFRQDGLWTGIPLSVVFAASNEIPQAANLRAIYDRLPQRYEVRRIAETGNFLKMLDLIYTDVDTVMSWAQMAEIQAYVRTIPIDPKVKTTMAEIRQELDEKHNLVPSDRRWYQALDILRGEAFLDGCDRVTVDHIPCLVNVLWDQVQNIPDVDAIVLEKANPAQRAAMSLLADIDKIIDTVNKALAETDDDERMRLALEAHPKAKSAKGELDTLRTTSARSKRAEVVMGDCQAKLLWAIQQLTQKIISPSSAPTP